MINDGLMNALRYKSEGTDLDFKSEQYRFVGGNDYEKSEMLKDILALANAWRDGTAYILLGLKDSRPHLAEVVGISEHIDDSRLQQFVNSKVKPKLTFHYEEHLYEGKTVGIIAIPKQKRPFFIEKPYGKLKGNIVYVRRGSSTEEAEPTEVVAMGFADSGRGQVRLALSVLTPENEMLPENIELKHLNFPEKLPDYESPQSQGLFGISISSGIWSDNKSFWREYAEYLRVNSALIEMKFVLKNSSDTQLTNTKLEVWVEPVDGQSFQMFASADLPEHPQSQRSVIAKTRSLPGILDRQERRFVVNEGGLRPICNVRYGSLLAGEEGYASDTLAIVPSAPGALRIHFRILAAELSKPQESDFLLQTTGELMTLDIDKLDEIYGQALITKYEDDSH